jgi:hypothetical protein
MIWAPLALAEEGLTLKERLSDKASDAQRVNDCRVPLERRGPVARPDCRQEHAAPAETAPAKPPGSR